MKSNDIQEQIRAYETIFNGILDVESAVIFQKNDLFLQYVTHLNNALKLYFQKYGFNPVFIHALEQLKQRITELLSLQELNSTEKYLNQLNPLLEKQRYYQISNTSDADKVSYLALLNHYISIINQNLDSTIIQKNCSEIIYLLPIAKLTKPIVYLTFMINKDIEIPKSIMLEIENLLKKLEKIIPKIPKELNIASDTLSTYYYYFAQSIQKYKTN